MDETRCLFVHTWPALILPLVCGLNARVVGWFLKLSHHKLIDKDAAQIYSLPKSAQVVQALEFRDQCKSGRQYARV